MSRSINISHIINEAEVVEIFNVESSEALSKGIVKGIAIMDCGSYMYYTTKGSFMINRAGEVFINVDDKNAGWLLREEKLKRILKK